MKVNFDKYKSYYEKYKGLFSVKVAAAVLLAVVLIGTASFVYNTMEKDITIIDIDGQKSVTTFKSTVADVLEESGVKLRPQDKINQPMTAKLRDGLSIRVSRAKNVVIHMDGRDLHLLTTADNVGSALKEAKVQLRQTDKIVPEAAAKLNGDTTIKVIRVTEKVISKIEKVSFANQINKNEKLDKGIVRVIRKGQNGEKELSIKVVYEDGKEVSRQIVSQKITKQAIAGVIEEGARTTIALSRGRVVRFTKAIRMMATAYDSSYQSCGKNPGDAGFGITATGMRVKYGIVAVDPRVIPLGTWLYIDGYGEALAADVGGAIKGNRIDVYMESAKAVARYGRRTVKVYILDKARYRF